MEVVFVASRRFATLCQDRRTPNHVITRFCAGVRAVACDVGGTRVTDIIRRSAATALHGGRRRIQSLAAPCNPRHGAPHCKGFYKSILPDRITGERAGPCD